MPASPSSILRMFLPRFVRGHALVQFHDENDHIEITNAKGEQTEYERILQDDLAAHSNNTDYPSTDTIVERDLTRADGLTSLDLEYSRSHSPQYRAIPGGDPLVTIAPADKYHRPVLDLDMDAVLIPSSTPGHHHLIIDHLMPWDHYLELLSVLQKVGLIEDGYLDASADQGYSSIRLPWIQK